jgi:hypothetical protein
LPQIEAKGSMESRHSRVIRWLLLLLPAVTVWPVAEAQKFSAGLRAGPTFNWLSFGDKDDKEDFSTNIKFGFSAAAIIQFPLKSRFDLHSDFGFALRGRNILFNNDTWENNATYSYAEGTMLLRRSFHLQIERDVPGDWYLGIGPRITYWINGHGKVTSGGSYKYDVYFEPAPDEPTEPDFNKMSLTDINRWLFGLDIAVGLAAPIRQTERIVTEVRFTSGHTYFGEKNSAFNRTLGFTDNLRTNEKVISLNVAYVFDFDLRESKKGRSTKDKEMHRKPVHKRRH